MVDAEYANAATTSPGLSVIAPSVTCSPNRTDVRTTRYVNKKLTEHYKCKLRVDTKQYRADPAKKVTTATVLLDTY